MFTFFGLFCLFYALLHLLGMQGDWFRMKEREIAQAPFVFLFPTVKFCIIAGDYYIKILLDLRNIVAGDWLFGGVPL